jgi:hypothetical protein
MATRDHFEPSVKSATSNRCLAQHFVTIQQLIQQYFVLHLYIQNHIKQFLYRPFSSTNLCIIA